MAPMMTSSFSRIFGFDHERGRIYFWHNDLAARCRGWIATLVEGSIGFDGHFDLRSRESIGLDSP
jgi:hypothetical protein